MTPRNVVLEGDALTVLAGLGEASVECVITSPPYFQARHYDAGEHELGREAHVEQWVEGLREVSREIARVLVPTGSYWLNVGDLYSRHVRLGARRSRCYSDPSDWSKPCSRMAGSCATGWPGSRARPYRVRSPTA